MFFYNIFIICNASYLLFKEVMKDFPAYIKAKSEGILNERRDYKQRVF